MHLHFFQETDIQGYWNNSFSYKPGKEDSINLPLKLDIDSNRNLYIYLDLAGDGNLAEVKPEYIQTIDPRQLQLQDNEFNPPCDIVRKINLISQDLIQKIISLKLSKLIQKT